MREEKDLLNVTTQTELTAMDATTEQTATVQHPTLRDFIYKVYGASAVDPRCKDFCITVTETPTDVSRHLSVTDLDSVAGVIYTMGQRTNAYYNVGLRYPGMKQAERGGKDAVAAMTCFCADIDVAGEQNVHAENCIPATMENGLAFLNSLELQPTVITCSGNGLHALWVFSEPIICGDALGIIERDTLEELSNGFGLYVRGQAQQHGWKVDNVSDLPRMLRAPGTLNFKTDPPKQAYVISLDGPTYTIHDFEKYKIMRTVQESKPIPLHNLGSAERMRGHCKFIDSCVENQANVTEPEWYAMLSIVSQCKDGEGKAHEWSEEYPGYSSAETQYKYEHAYKANKPCSCRYIHDCLGFGCPVGGCQKLLNDKTGRMRQVKTPLAFAGFTTAERLEKLVSADTPTATELTDEENVSLAAYAYNNDMSAYIDLKAKAKKVGIGNRDYDRLVKQCIECEAAERAANRPLRPEDDFSAQIDLDGLNTNGAVTPDGWSVDMTGIQKPEQSNKGMVYPMDVSAEPVVVSKILQSIDDPTEKLELTFRRNESWKFITVPRAQAMNQSSIVGLADVGFPVSSGTAGHMNAYLTAYEATNKDCIPICRCISRAGWIKKQGATAQYEFFPFYMQKEIVYDSDCREADNMISALHEQGDYQVWLDMADTLRQTPYARAMVAASFASPLLSLLQMRTSYLHIWCDSLSGKTAALKAALSVWGNPQGLLGTYNTTLVGMERSAGCFCNLPLGLDEFQCLNQKKMDVASIVYNLCNGRGKTRGSKFGGIQQVASWCLFILSTGEQPISSDNTMDGINNRLLELYGKPVNSADLAGEVHRTCERNYGFAGRIFLKYLVEQVLTENCIEGTDAKAHNNSQLKEDYKQIRDELVSRAKKEHIDLVPQLDTIAVLALADVYASIAVFDWSRDKAFEDAIEFALVLLRNVAEHKKVDVIESAWNTVTGWVAANKGHFIATSGLYQPLEPRYGTVENGKYYVLIDPMKNALQNAGYNHQKSVQGFADRGYITRFTDSNGKHRSSTVKNFNGASTRFYELNLTREEIWEAQNNMASEDVPTATREHIDAAEDFVDLGDMDLSIFKNAG